MSRRPSVYNGYSNQEPIPMLLAGHQQPMQGIPMQPQYRPPPTAYQPSSYPNRGHPPTSDYPPANQLFRAPSSARSSRPLMPTSQLNQQRGGYFYNDPNRSYPVYNQPNRHSDGFLPGNDDPRWRNPSDSFWGKPLCLGLTRLSGGLLFGGMTLLAAASIAGLVVSVIFYVNDMTTDPQWKILGMVVSGIMLLTVLVTFCIFFCCYKQGRILGDNPGNDPLKYPQRFDGNDYHRSLDREHDPFYPSPYRSSVPYGALANGSPDSAHGDLVRVSDKLTNTETTGAPLRPRDFQRGAWPSVNAYGGVTQRPAVPPHMASRAIQASPTQPDPYNASRRVYPNNNLPKHPVPPPGTRIEYIDDEPPRQLVEKRTRRFIEHPRYDIVEEIIERPRPKVVGEYVDFVEEPKRAGDLRGQGKSRFENVSIKPIQMQERLNPSNEEFANNHFYQ